MSPDCFLTLRSLTHSLTQVDGENACQDEEKKTKKTKEREQDKSEENQPKKRREQDKSQDVQVSTMVAGSLMWRVP